MSGGVGNTEIEFVKSRLDLLSIAEGYCQSTILFAMQRLGLFESIGGRGASIEALAADIDADESKLARLLRGGESIGVLVLDGNFVQISPRFLPLLAPDSPDPGMGGFLALMHEFSLAMNDVASTVKGKTCHKRESSSEVREQQKAREFALAMHSYASFSASDFVNSLDLAGTESVLDVGCGPGTYSLFLGKKFPGLTLSLLDRPEMLSVAKEIRSLLQVNNRVSFLPMDAVSDEIDGTYDLILVSNLLHVLGEQDSRALLTDLYPKLRAGGSLIVQAQFLDEGRLSNRWPVYMDLIQLCITKNGRNHSLGETKEWLQEAGFGAIDYCGMSLFSSNSYLRAYKN